MSSRRCSPAAPPPDDDDLLPEILLHLPPQPSSLPRASLVCKRWRSLVSDPRFTRRSRLHHRRRNPPLLGWLTEDILRSRISFLPAMEAPNRVPRGRFSLQFHDDSFKLLNSHHGLVLVFHTPQSQVLVWDPVTGDQHRISVPAEFDKEMVHGTVLRSAEHFQVVLAVEDDKDKQHRRLLACIYSSETGVWGDLVSTPIPSTVLNGNAARQVGNSLYWLFAGNSVAFLEFDLEQQKLSRIPLPVDMYAEGRRNWDFIVMRAEGGGLGLFFLSNFTAQLWKRTTDGDGAAAWVLERTNELDKLLSVNPEVERGQLWIEGFACDKNVVFLRTLTGFFMIHLESLQFTKLSGSKLSYWYHPFESVYAAGI